MNNIYYWIGAVIFWAIAAVATLCVLLGLWAVAGFIYREVWMRTYIFQWYELVVMKKLLKKNDFTVEGVDGVFRILRDGKRFETHIFLPQIYEVAYAMREKIYHKIPRRC